MLISQLPSNLSKDVWMLIVPSHDTDPNNLKSPIKIEFFTSTQCHQKFRNAKSQLNYENRKFQNAIDFEKTVQNSKIERDALSIANNQSVLYPHFGYNQTELFTLKQLDLQQNENFLRSLHGHGNLHPQRCR